MDLTLAKSLILNLSFTNYVKLCLIESSPSLSETTFRRKLGVLQALVLSFYISQLDTIVNNFRNMQIIVSIDTRWSARGYCANESTTTFFYLREDLSTFSLLYTINCVKRGKKIIIVEVVKEWRVGVQKRF